MCEGRHLARSFLGTVDPSAVGLQFVVEVESPDEELVAEVTPDVCCLVLNDGVNCDIMNVVGGCYDVIPKGSKRDFKLVAPLIDPFDRRGHCVFYLDTRPTDRARPTTRDVIKVLFDTRLFNKKQDMIMPDNVKPCLGYDEDPLNSCKPVDCEVYYNGIKSHFDQRKKRCVAVPNCAAADESEPPIYNPESNKCDKEQSVSHEDIEFIKSLKENARTPKDILIIKNRRTTTEIYNVTAYGTDFFPENNKLHVVSTPKAIVAYKSNFSKNTITKYLVNNKYTLIVLFLVIVVQCCLICTMIYCITRCACCGNKKVVSKYFNYRQDASVTTPLIYTSNVDTDTTEANFTSESSNIDNRIKCYKACQKETTKYSLSDDILTKCLNRRKWDRVPKSDTIQEYNENFEKAKVNFEDEIRDARERETNVREVTSIDTDALKVKASAHETQCDLSEKEIKCHTYNIKSDVKNIVDAKKNDTASVSTEKGAQAQFSNDSIDDFLSERGMIFLAGENSFESSSTGAKSSISSRTSKNNVLKNVLSMLSRRSKPSSIPRRRRSREGLDLELIHMSRASVFTSSNDSKGGKKKDSRTSL